MNDQQEELMRRDQRRIHAIDDTLTLKYVFDRFRPVYLVSDGLIDYVLRLPQNERGKSIKQEVQALKNLAKVKETPKLVHVYGTNEPTALLKTFMPGRKIRLPNDQRFYMNAYTLLDRIYENGVVRLDIHDSNVIFAHDGIRMFDFNGSLLAKDLTNSQIQKFRERDFRYLKRLFYGSNLEEPFQIGDNLTKSRWYEENQIDFKKENITNEFFFYQKGSNLTTKYDLISPINIKK